MEQSKRTKRRKIAAKVAEHFRLALQQTEPERHQDFSFDSDRYFENKPLEEVHHDHNEHAEDSSQRPVMSSSDEEWDNTADEPEVSPPSPLERHSSQTSQLNITHQILESPAPSTPFPVFTPPNPTRPSQATNTSFTESMLGRILAIVEGNRETLRVHGRILQALLKKHDGSVAAALPEGAVFPLRTVADVESLEQRLADPVFLKEVVAVVAEIGGSTIDEATRRMMAYIMDHTLSTEYNFVGRHGKREFRGLQLFEVLYGSLKKNALTGQITRKEVEKAVSKWLIGARDRGGNRNARAQRRIQEGTNGLAE